MGGIAREGKGTPEFGGEQLRKPVSYKHPRVRFEGLCCVLCVNRNEGDCAVMYESLTLKLVIHQ